MRRNMTKTEPDVIIKSTMPGYVNCVACFDFLRPVFCCSSLTCPHACKHFGAPSHTFLALDTKITRFAQNTFISVTNKKLSLEVSAGRLCYTLLRVDPLFDCGI